MKLRIDHVFEDAEDRRRGLMGTKLPAGSCALFHFESSAPHSFWMKGVPTDLYLSALDAGKCVESHFMQANTTKPHQLLGKCRLVAESRLEIPVGAKVAILGDYLVVDD